MKNLFAAGRVLPLDFAATVFFVVGYAAARMDEPLRATRGA
jgi:hypothetical protein